MKTHAPRASVLSRLPSSKPHLHDGGHVPTRSSLPWLTLHSPQSRLTHFTEIDLFSRETTMKGKTRTVRLEQKVALWACRSLGPRGPGQSSPHDQRCSWKAACSNTKCSWPSSPTHPKPLLFLSPVSSALLKRSVLTVRLGRSLGRASLRTCLPPIPLLSPRTLGK